MRTTLFAVLLLFWFLCGAACSKECEQDDVADATGESGSTDEGLTPDCETRATKAACDGHSGSGWQCTWVDVTSYTGTTCEGGTTEGQCVALVYQGAGCQVAYSCGASEGTNTYYRNAGEEGVQIFQVQACEDQPEPDWTQCSWEMEGEDVYPHWACACSCGP